jgi:hypothetical protein
MTSLKIRQSPPASSIFPSFFAGGFECSTPINFDRTRIDELVHTGHDSQVRADYRRLRTCGIRTARDGVRWNLIDKAGELDFSTVIPYIQAAEAEKTTIIWDLFHYGYPDDLDPFDNQFIERFAAYCHAFARMLVKRAHGEIGFGGQGYRFYTPVNEISFFAWAGGEVGIFAPFQLGRGADLKRRLAEAAIAGINAIRSADPRARIVNCDPIVRVVAPLDAPWMEEEAAYFNDNFVCEAWDILNGTKCPELGGSPKHLDIVGVNYYGVNQWEHQRHDSVLPENDPRRTPFSTLLCDLDNRYHRPIFVAETSSSGDDRERWLRNIAAECWKAMDAGVDLHGICIYPILGMTDWHTGEYRQMGLWDQTGSQESRDVYPPLLATLHELNRKMQPVKTTYRRQASNMTSAGVA